VLDLILGISATQDELLASIKADTQLIRGADLATAKLLLDEAKRTQKDAERSREFVEQARNHLYRALGSCKNNAERAVVQRQLSLVYLTLGLVDDSRHWFSESLQSSRNAVSQFIKQAQRDTQLRKVRYVDGRTGQAPPLFHARDFAFEVNHGSPLINIIGLLDFLITGLWQGVRAVRNVGKPNSVETLTDFIQFHNEGIVLAGPIGVRTDRQMLMLSKEMTLFTEPAFMLRFVSASEFKDIVDSSIEHDPDFRIARSPSAFRKALGEELLNAARTERQEPRSEHRVPTGDPKSKRDTAG
jgi:hypothetical protein